MKIDSLMGHVKDFSPNHSTVHQYLNTFLISQVLTLLGMLLTAGIAVFWLMKVLQIPTPTDTLLKSNKGVTLYSNIDIAASYRLFGSSPLATENIVLRGLVITDRNKDQALDGFALFDIDGKPTGPIAVRESLGKGLILKSITADSAVLTYQGKELNFSIQNSKKKKSAVPYKKN